MAPKRGDRERRVLEAVHRAALFCDEKIGWNRIGFVLSVTIIAIAAVVLYRILHNINAGEVVDALLRTDWQPFRAGRLVRRRRLFHAHLLRPVRACAPSGAPTCPIGRRRSPASPAIRSATTSGASVFTGGAVRYRLYSAWGLNAIDVAKICFVAGLTFWLGNATVLGLGIAYAPHGASAINQLPAWFNRGGAILILMVLDALCHLGVAAPARRRPDTAGASPCRRVR